MFWYRGDERFAHECRRFPPQYAEVQDGRKLALKRVWPITPPTDWCGEFHPVSELGDTKVGETIGDISAKLKFDPRTPNAIQPRPRVF
ncbi:hypothetical protein [Pararhizobium mangrovi]|uniref:Uncharacterized protein n=1 Tax=Pararhizobium mangrovi TaxID=2590452 RepID=A0A506U0Q4_9HYPH|nr:hypothetical protein [Pararhizobium mangrovi]TPW27933.1 hypothetical protein FJU11_10335 [Pararhizobium mangrovi]